MKQRKITRALIVLMMTVVLVMGAASMSYAVSISTTRYNGGGVVTVYFSNAVKYNKPSITVKDNIGKSYTTTIGSKNKSSMQFKIGSCKTGKTYKITVSGIGGSAKCSLKLYSKASAIKMAKAKSGGTNFKKVVASSTTYNKEGVWKVSFNCKNKGTTYKRTYWISQQTNVVRHSQRSKV